MSDPPASGTASTSAAVNLSPDIISAIQEAVNTAMANQRSNVASQSGDNSVTLSQQSAVLGRSIPTPTFLPTFSLCSATGFATSLPTSSMKSFCSPAFSVQPNLATPLVSSLAFQAPTLHQPFVIGPGYPPVSSKLVTQIVSGKYVDLNDLTPANLHPTSDNDPQLFLDGRVVLTNSAKRSRGRLEDIVSWTEAFSIYCMVFCQYFPHRWNDMTRYKLLIIRTQRLFGGHAWLLYDREFREHAAATRLTDWSSINAQLYNFHTAGSSGKRESASPVVCISWNRGRCTSPYIPCRFAHKCSHCSGTHRATDCTRKPSFPDKQGNNSRQVSPGRPSSKYRKL